MGIRGLQSYMERTCMPVCKTVDIQELANEHRNKHKCQPVLLIDGVAFAHTRYQKSYLEWVYGGQWLQFREKLEEFISRFRKIDVKLIFFFDGVTCSDREAWVARRRENCRKIRDLTESIRNCPDVAPSGFRLPTAMGILLVFALKSLGVQVYKTDTEADRVIARYAHDHPEVFGILAQDTDFLVYETKPFFSLDKLEEYSFKTVFYDRELLTSKYLKLSSEQMPLLAILSKKSCERFHQKLLGARQWKDAHKLIQGICEFIKRKGWTGNFENETETSGISQEVFRSDSKRYLVEEQLKIYCMDNKVTVQTEPTDWKGNLHKKHINGDSAFVYNIVFEKEFGLSENFEVHWKESASLFYREIRQRCYGVLFNCFCSSKKEDGSVTDLKIEEWCAYYHNSLENPEFVEPLPLKNGLKTQNDAVPRVEDLWLNSSNEEQMRIFWKILNVPSDFDALLLDSKKKFIAPLCVLHFLMEKAIVEPSKVIAEPSKAFMLRNEDYKGWSQRENEPKKLVLQPWEILVLLAEIAKKKSQDELKKLQIRCIDLDAVHLTTNFMVGILMVLMALSTCGNPLETSWILPWNYFDGKEFSYLYGKANTFTEGGKKPLRIDHLLNKKEDIDQFYELFNLLTQNLKHFNWHRHLQRGTK